MYCSNCGSELNKEAYVCPKCGVKTNNKSTSQTEDVPNVGLNILSIFIPIVGIILYFVYKNETPAKAKSVLTFALIGLGINVGISIISFIISFIFAFLPLMMY